MAKQSSNKPFAPLAVGFLIGAITVGTAVLVWRHDSASQPPSSRYTPNASATVTAPPIFDSAKSTVVRGIEPAVARVAARFACSCGTCGEERLDICRCATAQQERAFIQEQLRNGHTEAEAAEAVNQKYGGLKS